MGQLPGLLFCDHSIRELVPLPLGIIGFGQIGSKLAEVGLSMGMKVLHITNLKKQAQGWFYTQPGWPAFPSRCGIFAPAIVRRVQNAMINQNTLAKMKGNAILINTGGDHWLMKMNFPNTWKPTLLYGYPGCIDPGATTLGPSIAGTTQLPHHTPHCLGIDKKQGSNW